MAVEYVAGAYQAKWNNLDLGYTKEGLLISIEDLFEEIRIDRLGRSIYDLLFVGKLVTVSIPSLNWTSNTLAAMSQSGSLGGLTNLGRSALDTMAKAVVLTPLTGNANDTFTCHKAVNKRKLEVPLATLPRVIPFEFLLLPDLAQAAGKEFFERST